MSQQSEQQSVGEEEKLWGFLAWLLSIVGAILALVLKPGYRYARYWAYLSISFFILIVIASVVNSILSLIPFVGWLLAALVALGLLIIWILGIIKSLQPLWWRPPVVYDIARAIGIDRI